MKNKSIEGMYLLQTYIAALYANVMFAFIVWIFSVFVKPIFRFQFLDTPSFEIAHQLPSLMHLSFSQTYQLLSLAENMKIERVIVVL